MPFVSFSKVLPEENLDWTPGISSVIVLLQGAFPGPFVHGLKGQSINRPLLCASPSPDVDVGTGRAVQIWCVLFCWKIGILRKSKFVPPLQIKDKIALNILLMSFWKKLCWSEMMHRSIQKNLKFIWNGGMSERLYQDFWDKVPLEGLSQWI